jgi:ParB family transcriptional regulator, chromosome partitioning protein
LNALLSADRATITAEESLEIDIDLIDPSPAQPRSRFDQRALDDLAKSIRENGIVQPVLVRRRAARFELIAGERRWRAARQAGLERIPALLRDVPDEKLLELALIENIQREDLNPIEEAQAYKNLIEKIGLTQESLAERVGRDRSYITNYLRLLRLPDDLQGLVQEGKLSTGHARTLLGVTTVEGQRHAARKIIDKGLSVRETEQLIRRMAKRESDVLRTNSHGIAKDPNIRAAEARLRRKLGTQVRIVDNAAAGNGRIEIEYYNTQDLDRIYAILMAETPGAR